MPFDEEDNDQTSAQSQKIGLKNVSTQKSIFDSMPKKPTQEDFDGTVKRIQERASQHKSKAADLAMQFNKSMSDKTLAQNRNPFQKELEKDLLQQMAQLAIDINNDPNEKEGMGSLSWIILLLKTCFAQRDKINQLEYAVSQMEKITKALDPGKKSG